MNDFYPRKFDGAHEVASVNFWKRCAEASVKLLKPDLRRRLRVNASD